MTDLEGKLFMAGLVTDLYTIGYGGYRGLMTGLGIPFDMDSTLDHVLAGVSFATFSKWTACMFMGADEAYPSREELEGIFAAPAVGAAVCGGELVVGYALGYGVGKLIDLIT